jgi:hypothetical protein
MKNMENTEPVGIVISRGTTPAVTTSRLAYVWGPAPELDVESDRAVTRAA